MTGERITRLDPLDHADPSVVRGWAGVFEAAARVTYGDRHASWTADERLVHHRMLADEAHWFALAAFDGDEPIGAVEVMLPLLDNTDRAEFELAVHPAHERRGVGSALLEQVERIAAGAGRTVLGMESDVADGYDDTAAKFAARHGYTAAQVELRSELALPPDEAVLARLETEARAASAGYTVLTSWDGVPDEWLAGRAVLSRRMSTDPPLGDLTWEEERWDADRVRRGYDVARAQHRRVVDSVVRHDATGELVGYTQLAISAGSPDVAYQWDTIVLPEHRGHRLGLLVKAANLRALRAELPAVTRVATWNAAENEPMLRVNRALGFRPVGRLTEWQKHT